MSGIRQLYQCKTLLRSEREVNGITVYYYLAHHPEAILATLTALRDKVGGGVRILAVLEPVQTP